MEFLNSFYWEIQNLKVEVKIVKGHQEVLSLDRYNRLTTTYGIELSKLQAAALTEILTMHSKHIQYNVNRLQLRVERFQRMSDLVYLAFTEFIQEGDIDKAHAGIPTLLLMLDDYSLKIDPPFSPTFVTTVINDAYNTYYESRTSPYFENIRNKIHIRYVDDIHDFLIYLHDAIVLKRGHTEAILWEIKNITGIEPQLQGSSEDRANDEPKTGKQIVSYAWLSEDAQTDIPKLFDALSKKYIVHTDLIDFQAVFSGKIIGAFKPVKWTGNASELLYFITSLMPELIADERRRMNWQKLKACFSKPDGQPFNEDFRGLKSRLDIDLSQNKREKIDHLLNQFL